MKTLLALTVLLTFAGCTTKPTAVPRASTAAVGVNLNELGDSLGAARSNVAGIRGNLSEVDAKAVRIQESIRNW